MLTPTEVTAENLIALVLHEARLLDARDYDTWNRVFTDDDDIVGHCCFYWNRLIEQPWRIMSIGMREWAHRF